MTSNLNRDAHLPIIGFMLILMCQIQISAPQRTKDPKYKRVCYYTNWSQYRRDQGRFLPSDIDPFLCTHLIFAFAKVDKGVLAPYEWNDLQPPFLYKQFTDLKKKNPDLKTLLAVGGWNHGSLPFTAMVSSKVKRAKFISHAMKYLRSNRFDGLDLDWEYPASRGSPARDKQNFVALAKELREAFENEAKKTGSDRLLLTTAVPGGEKHTLAGYDVKKLNKYVDFFNLMSYDLHGGWSPTIGHHAPLTGGNSWAAAKSKPENVEKAVNLWLKLGADPEKLVMGLAFYGKTFKLCSKNHRAGNKSCGAGRPDTLPYYEILRQLQTRRLRRSWMQQEQVPFAVSDFDRLWVGYDDEQSLVAKVNYAKKKRLGGVMVWSLDQDDFTGRFGGYGVRYPLLTTIRDALEGKVDKKPRLLASEENKKFGPSEKLKYSRDLKAKPVSFKRNKLEKIASNKERLTPLHPSAVPLFANLLGTSGLSHEKRGRQKGVSQPYKSARSKISHPQPSSKRKEGVRKGRKDVSQDNRNKQRLFSQYGDHRNRVKYTSRASGREGIEMLSEEINTKDKQVKSKEKKTQSIQRTRPFRFSDAERKHNQNFLEAESTTFIKKMNKDHRQLGRLIRGKRRRKSGKRARGKSPHRKNPVLYHPTNVRKHIGHSSFPQRVPFSVISVQTNPLHNKLHGYPNFDHPIDVNRRESRRLVSRRQKDGFGEAIRQKEPDNHLTGTKTKSNQDFHSSSERFSASLDMNKSDNTVVSFDKPSGHSLHARNKIPLPRDRVVNDLAGEDSLDDKEIKNQAQENVGDYLIEDKLVDEISDTPEYVIIQHDPNKKWYEPILHTQHKEELDLKLANAVPYIVPWRSENDVTQTKTHVGTKRQQDDDDYFPKHEKASQLIPYSGNKFARVHAVPLSGFSLADVVRSQSSEDSKNDSGTPGRGHKNITNADNGHNHLQKYHSPRPWFSRQSKAVHNTIKDKNLTPGDIPEADDIINIKKSTTRTRKHEIVNGLRREHGYDVRKMARRHLHPKPFSLDLKRASPKTEGARATFNVEVIGLKTRRPLETWPADVAETLRQEKHLKISYKDVNSPFTSGHSKDVWWEFPEIETYQALTYKGEERLDNSSFVNEIEHLSHGSERSINESITTTEASQFFASAPVFSLNDTEPSTMYREMSKTKLDNQSKGFEFGNISSQCADTNLCNNSSKYSDEIQEGNGSGFETLAGVATYETDLPTGNLTNSTLVKSLESLEKQYNISYSSNETDAQTLTKRVDHQVRNESIDFEASINNNSEDANADECISNGKCVSNASKARAEKLNQTIGTDSTRTKPVPYSRLKMTSKRRKAGRRNPQPEVYRSRDSSQSPFKPPPRADLYYNSPKRRAKSEGKLDLDFGEIKHGRQIRHHQTRQLQKLSKLLQNTSIAEKLNSKLGEIQREATVASTSPEEDRATLETNSEQQEFSSTRIPRSQKITRRRGKLAWYEVDKKLNKVNSSVTDYIDSLKSKSKEISENVNKDKVKSETIQKSMLLENKIKLENMGEERLNKETSEALDIKAEEKYPTNKEAAKRIRSQYNIDGRGLNPSATAGRTWWDKTNENAMNVTIGDDVAGIKANTTVERDNSIKILKSKNESSYSVRLNKEKRKDITRYRPRRTNSVRDNRKHPNPYSKTKEREAKFDSVKVVRARPILKTREPPQHEIYRANYHAFHKMMPSAENTGNSNNTDDNKTNITGVSFQPEGNTTLSPTSTRETTYQTTFAITPSTPKSPSIKSSKRVRHRQHGEKSKTNDPAHEEIKFDENNKTLTPTLSAPGGDRQINSTKALTGSTDALVMSDNNRPAGLVEQRVMFPEPETYHANFHLVKKEGDNLEPNSIKELVREDGKGGWSFMTNSVTPAPIPGASLVDSGFSTGSFSCPSTFGIYKDPDNCRMFYQCVWFVAFHHICGQGTAWNDYDRICDWPLRTSC
ncbi:chitinase-3-like protein 1 [Elysia marginata]|uniref:Chitinase-3-like protein 1 n=1 Tax=Elysia marginata TaxID=1093978 RepID=A0AAV4GI58_9GAST|nr:chitinase-3-like protein 1 [Elysia marginata]